jgi:hypothetical protein
VAGHTGVGVLLVWLWRRSNSYILICVSARPLAWAVCARLHTHARPYSLLRYLRENAKVLTIHTHNYNIISAAERHSTLYVVHSSVCQTERARSAQRAAAHKCCAFIDICTCVVAPAVLSTRRVDSLSFSHYSSVMQQFLFFLLASSPHQFRQSIRLSDNQQLSCSCVLQAHTKAHTDTTYYCFNRVWIDLKEYVQEEMGRGEE